MPGGGRVCLAFEVSGQVLGAIHVAAHAGVVYRKQSHRFGGEEGLKALVSPKGEGRSAKADGHGDRVTPLAPEARGDQGRWPRRGLSLRAGVLQSLQSFPLKVGHIAEGDKKPGRRCGIPGGSAGGKGVALPLVPPWGGNDPDLVLEGRRRCLPGAEHKQGQGGCGAQHGEGGLEEGFPRWKARRALIGAKAPACAGGQDEALEAHRAASVRRSAMSSARIAIAISGGVLLPMGRPTGAWSLARAASGISRAARRLRREALVRLEPMAPT